MAQQPYPITGVEDTGVQPRIELRDLEKKPIHFSLFIQAMNRLQNMNNTKDATSDNSIDNPNSWWQMGTIHGLPYNPWSGDPKGPQTADPNAQWGGYCYHAYSGFIPTLAPYFTFQAVVNEAIAIASDTKDEKWLQAAKELRFPFWDWTRPETASEGIPKICQEPKVEIATVNGSPVVVDNPLNHYKFTLKPGAAAGAPYMGEWDRTYRWADQNDQPTKEMYDQSLKAFSEGIPLTVGKDQYKLQPVHWLRGKVAALFTYDLTVEDPAYGGNMWGYFSNTGAQDDKIDPAMPVMPPSLEEPHNMVHLDTGGNGSMSLNEYAGFDPIFFLHHCNVDRLYAFWEYLYPKYWVGDGWKSTETGKIVPFLTDSGTFWQDSGSQVNQTTDLIPFRNGTLDYWTSNETRGLLSTGSVNKHYTYPPIVDPNTGTEVNVHVPYEVDNLALREQYQQILFNTFSPDFNAVIEHHRLVARLLRPPAPAHLPTLLPAHLPAHLPVPLPTDFLLKTEGDIVHLRHFYLVGELPEFAFPGSYRLELYLLNSPNQSAAVVNSISVLGRADPDRCTACRDRRAAGNHVRGHMPLDPRLILHLIGQLHPTRLAVITELNHLAVLIHESFGVRLVKPDGTRLAAADPNVSAHHTALHASKTPKLSLHSHIIQLNPDPTAPIKFHGHSHHGTFGTGVEWKAF